MERVYEYCVTKEDKVKIGRVNSNKNIEEVHAQVQEEYRDWEIESIREITCSGCILGLLSQEDHYGGCLDEV